MFTAERPLTQVPSYPGGCRVRQIVEVLDRMGVFGVGDQGVEAEGALISKCST